jgi:hypothetical protein
MFQASPFSEERKGKQEDKQSDVYIVTGVDAHGTLYNSVKSPSKMFP